jgi:DNA repair exonuclease SbcCD nuclease subunit
MKVVLLGDSHFGASNSSDIIHNYFEKFYNFFFDYLEQNNINTIIQEGDLFDIRKFVHFNTLEKSENYFFSQLKKNNIKMITIAGNHDVLFKNTNKINAVSLLATDAMQVVDMYPETVLIGSKTFDMYPWINIENIDVCMEFLEKSKSDYAVGHFEFNDFPMYAGVIATSGMNHKLFSKYAKVFSGHYHTISQKDNVLFTGTPCELNWSDYGDLKGFWVLDTETDTLEHVKNPYRLFEKISYVEGMSYDFTQVCEKYVKIVVVDKKDQKKFDSFVDAVNMNSPHDVRIIEHSVVQSVKESVKTTELISTQSMLLSVVDNLDTTLDKNKLKNCVLEMYVEAMQLSNSL